MSYEITYRPDVKVEYHSAAWYLLLAQNSNSYGWITWGVDEDRIATMKWTRF